MQLSRLETRPRPHRVCLHGFAGTPATFDAFNAALAAREAPDAAVPTACPALPGHAAPLPPAPGGWAQAVDCVATVLTEGPCHLVGYSMGGRLALAVALAYPERVRTLTLVGVHPGLPSAEAQTERRRADLRWQQRLREHGTAAFLAAWQAQPLFASQAKVAPSTLQVQADARSKLLPEPLAAALGCMGTGSMPSYWAQLPTLQVPTLLVAGALDTKFVALNRRVVAELPHARAAEVAEVGHNVVLEAPEVLAELQHAHELRSGA